MRNEFFFLQIWPPPNKISGYATGGGRCHNLKNGKEASEDTQESPAGCPGEGKQNNEN